MALGYYGVRKIVIVNGHGGNLNALSELARELREQGVFASIFQWWHTTPKLLPDIFKPEERSHACAEETSMNLALYPHLVDMDKAVDEEPLKHSAQAEGVTLPLDSAEFTHHGVWGKSTSASTEKGKRVLDAVLAELVKHIELLRKARSQGLMQKPKA